MSFRQLSSRPALGAAELLLFQLTRFTDRRSLQMGNVFCRDVTHFRLCSTLATYCERPTRRTNAENRESSRKGSRQGSIFRYFNPGSRCW